MGYIIITLSIAILGFSVIRIVDIIFDDDKPDGKPLIFMLFVYSLFVLLLSSFYIKEPRAIDVYKGETTLRITYQDGVPIDSTVVWKSK